MATTPKPKILIVDDDEIILVALKETISSEPYDITATTSAQEALGYLEQEAFSVIISDQRMAEMTGLEFLQKAKTIQEDASRILITGVVELKTIIEAVNQGEIFRFIAKPWIREELLVTIQNAVQRHQLIEANKKLQQSTLSLNEELAQANRALESKLTQAAQETQAIGQQTQTLQKNFDQSIELCYRLLCRVHPLLGKETKAIVDICELMCQEEHLSPEDKHTLKISAWLQDIGLIGIPRELIKRYRETPEDLDEDELGLIQNHPIQGQELATFADNLAIVGATIRGCREHWDGSGFPDGLPQESIPTPARYLAVAIAFVESPLPREETVEEIINLSGHAFDPEAVRLFLKVTQLSRLPKKVKDVLFSELSPGMVLAGDVNSPAGLLLLPEGHVVNETSLKKIVRHNMSDPIHHQILVYA